MEHKGIQYQVVQTANPTGFRWTVQLDEKRTRTGVARAKGTAIFHAVSFIDRELRERPRQTVGTKQAAGDA
jgi:hypothetical protein